MKLENAKRITDLIWLKEQLAKTNKLLKTIAEQEITSEIILSINCGIINESAVIPAGDCIKPFMLEVIDAIDRKTQSIDAELETL